MAVGIMLELDGDATGFNKALRSISTESKKLQTELNQVDRALQVDPTNTVLLAQKQGLLAKAVEETQKKLTALNDAKTKADTDMANGVEVNQEQYRKLQREIVFTENKLKNLKTVASGGTIDKSFSKASDSAKKFDKNVDEAKRSVKELNTSVSNTSTQANKLGKTLTTAFKAVAAGYAGKALVQYLIGSNADMEQYLTSFEVMLGSASKAKSLMTDLTNFANVTPLQLTDVTKNATLLLNYGVAVDNVLGELRQLGDLSLGSAEKLDRISLAYGQMLAKGKVTGEELRQMTEAGVPLNQALADSIGVSTAELAKMIETGKVGIPDLNKAIDSLTTGTGKFAGMMEKQSKTLNGMISTLKDSFAQFGRDVGKKAFEEIKDIIVELMEALEEAKNNGSLDAIAEQIGNTIASLVTAIKSLAEVTTKFVDLGIVIKYVTDELNNFSTLLNNLSSIDIKGVNIGGIVTNSALDSLTASINPLKRIVGLLKDLKGILDGIVTYVGHYGGGSKREAKALISPFASMEEDARIAAENAKKQVDETVSTLEQSTTEIDEAFKIRQDEIDRAYKRQDISEEDYYNQSEQNLKDYNAEGLSAYNDYYDKIYIGRKKLNEDALENQIDANEKLLKEQETFTKKQEDLAKESLDTWEKSFNSIVDEASSSFNDIVKEQEDLANKLADTGDLFTIEDDTLNVNNIAEQTQQLEEYQSVLNQLKKAGASKEFLNEFLSLDISEGTDYAKTILGGDVDTYLQQWQEKQGKANQIAAEFYTEEADNFKETFAKEIKNSLDDMPIVAGDIGADTAVEFVRGLQMKLAELNGNMNLMAQQSMTATIAGSAKQSVGNISNTTTGQNAGTMSNQASPSVLQPIQLQIDGRTVSEVVIDYVNQRVYQTGKPVF